MAFEIYKVPGLQRLRKQKMLSRSELADRAGLSYGAVKHAELGGEVRPLNVRKLAKALGVEPSALTESTDG